MKYTSSLVVDTFAGVLRVTTDSFYCSTESESDQGRTSDTDYEMYQTEDKEN